MRKGEIFFTIALIIFILGCLQDNTVLSKLLVGVSVITFLIAGVFTEKQVHKEKIVRK